MSGRHMATALPRADANSRERANARNGVAVSSPSDVAAPARVPAGAVLSLVVGLALVRGLVGASVVPPFGGPDERGHFQHVASLGAPGGTVGVEARQPPLYYRLASTLLAAADRAGAEGPGQRLFAVRLLSVAAAAATVALIWQLARTLFGPDRELQAAAGLFAALLPVHAFAASTAANDSLATALSAAALVFVVRLRRQGWPAGRALVAALLAAAALSTKLTTLPIAAAGLVAALGAGARRLRGSRAALLGVAAVAVAAAAAGVLIGRHRESFFVTLLLPHVWPALLHLPGHYLRSGLPETFLTLWFPYVPDVPPFAPVVWLGAALSAVAALGLGRWLRATATSGRRLPAGMGVLVLALAFQCGVLAYRYSFAMELGNPMGGAAQAKFLLPALPALAVLCARGVWHACPRRVRSLAPAGLGTILLLIDGLGLGAYVLHQYEWQPA